MPVGFRATIFVVSLLVATSASAQPPASAENGAPTATLGLVRLEGAAECPSTQALARLVETRLGRRVWVAAPAADLAVEVSVAAAASGGAFDATVRVVNREGAELGRRDVQLVGARCELIAEPLAIVIAVAIDPGQEVAEPPVDPTRDPIQEILDASGPEPLPPGPLPTPTRDDAGTHGSSASPTETGPEPGPEDAAADDRSPSLRIGVGASLALGRLPEPGLGISAGARDAPLGWPLIIEGWFFVPGQAEASGGGSMRMWRGEIALYGCPLRPTWSWGAAWVCAGAHVSVLGIEAEGFMRNLGQVNVELDPSISLRGAIDVSRHFAIGLGATGSVPVPRHVYAAIDSSGESHEIYSTPAMRGLFTLELLVRP